jgi:hypothetical protein
MAGTVSKLTDLVTFTVPTKGSRKITYPPQLVVKIGNEVTNEDNHDSKDSRIRKGTV